MRTRDGTALMADVYRPQTDEPVPVLMIRQPYGRRLANTICYAPPDWYAAQGYIVVVQDVRGRGGSEGEFRLFADEAADGADAVAWAACLPGSSGAVGLYGFSFQGTNQLLAAAEAPPALKAVAPAMIGWDLRADWAYENEAFHLAEGIAWAAQLAAQGARRAGDEAAFAALQAASAATLAPADSPRLPVLERHRHLTHYFDWLDRPASDPYWQLQSPAARRALLARAAIPALFVGGWYDPRLPGTLAGWRASSEDGVATRLVIGPWGHFPWGSRLGELDFGEAALSPVDDLQLAWFDVCLKGRQDRAAEIPPLLLFDMGTCGWRCLDRWPERRVTFWLAGAGRIALDPRAGRLIDQAPADGGAATLIHDPWRPAPSLGGVHGIPAGPFDRWLVDQRPDVLTFTTAPLVEALPIAGHVEARITLATDAASCDVACVLSRVLRDGRVLPVAEGYRHLPRVDGRVSTTVPMAATCVTLAEGEALRLSIAGAAFPAYPINPGTGGEPCQVKPIEREMIKMDVITDGGSTLCLQVIDIEGL